MSANIQFGTYDPPPLAEDQISISVGLFFDGTLNNKDNTDERKKNSDFFKKKGQNKAEDTSYYNDWSNVARLWDKYKIDERLYIEGIGTTTKGSDSGPGFKYGKGDTGIRWKVRKGCENLAKEIANVAKTNKTNKITAVYLYVFGFSRGAAAARNFTYEIGKQSYLSIAKTADYVTEYTDADGEKVGMKQEKLPAMGHLGFKLKELNIDVKYIKVHFLGIFDTVSSYDPNSSNLDALPNFKNDVKELSLNTLHKATQVVHFTAENEHRENFGLTPTLVGISKEFPGVHSDIGGSYNTGTEIVDEIETDWIINPFRDLRKSSPELLKLKKQLIAEGWFLDDDKQLIIETEKANSYFKLKGTRYLDKTYSYIPLHFMAEHAIKWKTTINKIELQKKYSITNDSLLVRVKERLNKYVMGGGYPYTFNTNDSISQEQKDLRILRNKYLHWSADRDWFGMDPAKNRKRPIYY
ncbi:DUF2235 domain-containing protein [Apibacter raozihei]|uniref:T6SS phospholipase effector Tle1-like catalytic domain-containing protein n=1 Tax=Apibacter raozihei TaxID=2500547 RepID=UPI000FE3E84B|nr:DUF2235 domain-containing protein [Apibacter raozihei]